MLVFIFSVRLVYMYQARKPFMNRLAFIENVNRKMKEKRYTKLIVTGLDHGTDNMLMHSWGVQLESIMLSKLDNEMPQRSFLYADTVAAKKYMNTGVDTLIGCWQMLGPGQLNAYYFQIDTTTRYQSTGFSELMK